MYLFQHVYCECHAIYRVLFWAFPTDLNLLRQQAAKFILKRHWLESEILPYVLRIVGIAPILDPALVATVAATGLYFREGNTLEDLMNMDLLPNGCNLRQRSAVHDLLQFWEVSPDLLVRVLVELVANYWSWPGGGGVQPHNPRTS